MAEKYWLKLYYEILSDPKMGRMSDRLWRRTIELFLLAGELDKEGRLPEPVDMAWTLRLDLDELNKELEELARVGIVTCDGDGWQVRKFAERQAPSPAALRMRRMRERQKEKKKNQKEKKEEKERTYTDTYRASRTVRNGDVTSDVTRYAPTNNTHIHSGLADELTETAAGDDVQEMVNAIASVVKETYAIGINAEKFEQAATSFLRDERTPDDVKHFTAWWANHKYYDGKPALKTLVQELSNAADVQPVSNKEWWE